jgi:hypothetical protein
MPASKGFPRFQGTGRRAVGVCGGMDERFRICSARTRLKYPRFTERLSSFEYPFWLIPNEAEIVAKIVAADYQSLSLLENIWRRGRDSNPRYRCQPVQRFSKLSALLCCPAIPRPYSRTHASKLTRSHLIRYFRDTTRDSENAFEKFWRLRLFANTSGFPRAAMERTRPKVGAVSPRPLVDLLSLLLTIA